MLKNYLTEHYIFKIVYLGVVVVQLISYYFFKRKVTTSCLFSAQWHPYRMGTWESP